jgi:transposase InsO family protein
MIMVNQPANQNNENNYENSEANKKPKKSLETVSAAPVQVGNDGQEETTTKLSPKKLLQCFIRQVQSGELEIEGVIIDSKKKNVKPNVKTIPKLSEDDEEEGTDSAHCGANRQPAFTTSQQTTTTTSTQATTDSSGTAMSMEASWQHVQKQMSAMQKQLNQLTTEKKELTARCAHLEQAMAPPPIKMKVNEQHDAVGNDGLRNVNDTATTTKKLSSVKFGLAKGGEASNGSGSSENTTNKIFLTQAPTPPYLRTLQEGAIQSWCRSMSTLVNEQFITTNIRSLIDDKLHVTIDFALRRHDSSKTTASWFEPENVHEFIAVLPLLFRQACTNRSGDDVIVATLSALTARITFDASPLVELSPFTDAIVNALRNAGKLTPHATETEETLPQPLKQRCIEALKATLSNAIVVGPPGHYKRSITTILQGQMSMETEFETVTEFAWRLADMVVKMTPSFKALRETAVTASKHTLPPPFKSHSSTEGVRSGEDRRDGAREDSRDLTRDRDRDRDRGREDQRSNRRSNSRERDRYDNSGHHRDDDRHQDKQVQWQDKGKDKRNDKSYYGGGVTDKSGAPKPNATPAYCRHCGHNDHHPNDCSNANHPNCNTSQLKWMDSQVGKKFFELGFKNLPKDKVLDNKGGVRDRVPADTIAIGNDLETICLVMEGNNDLHENVICCPSLLHRSTKCVALLDSGATRSNFISQELYERLPKDGVVEQKIKIFVNGVMGSGRRCHNAVRITIAFVNNTISPPIPPTDLFFIVIPEIPQYEMLIGRRDMLKHGWDKWIGVLDMTLKDDDVVSEASTDIKKHDSQSHVLLAMEAKHSTENNRTVRTSLRDLWHYEEEAQGMEDVYDAIDDMLRQPAVDRQQRLQERCPVRVEGPPNLRDSIWELIQEFEDVFSMSLSRTPAAVPEMTVDVDTEGWLKAKGNTQRYRPMSKDKAKALQGLLTDLQEQGIIQPSNAPCWGYVNLVPKESGGFRLTVDYTIQNRFITAGGCRVPHQATLFQRIGDKRPQYFAVMDLTSGFHQTAIAPEHRALTAFTCPYGLYEYLRVPMGLKSSPAYFQYTIACVVLRGLVFDICESYQDDVITFGREEAELLRSLRAIFGRFRQHKITVNPKKCHFGMSEIKYLGHLIDATGISFTREKRDAVLQIDPPNTVVEMWSFIGVINYFRDHVKGCSNFTKPLSKLAPPSAPKKQRIEWTDEGRAAFNELKLMVNECPKLFFVTDDDPVFVFTDACDYGIGGYVMQVVNGEEHAIGFMSQSLSKQELNWSIIEKECYAIVVTLRKFEYLLRGRHFTLKTDHANLVYLGQPHSPKVMRWKLSVQAYDMNVEYILGKDNVVADAFSRIIEAQQQPRVDKKESDKRDPEVEHRTRTTKIREASMDTLRDNTWQHDISSETVLIAVESARLENQQIETGQTIKQEVGNGKELVQGLARLIADTEEICLFIGEYAIPTAALAMMKRVHNDVAGHCGVARMLERLNMLNQDWTGRREHCRHFIKYHCPACQKMSYIKVPIHTHPFTLATYKPMQRIYIDTISFGVTDAKGYKHALVVIDAFSKWVEIYPLQTLDAEEAAEALLIHIGRYGAPAEIVSDNGTQFRNHIVQELVRLVGLEHLWTIPYSSEGNGIAERMNREVLRHTRAMVFDREILDNWRIAIPFVQRILNSSRLPETGVSPAQLLFGNYLDLDRGIYDVMSTEVKTTERLSSLIATSLAVQKRVMQVSADYLRQRDATHMQREREEPTVFENDDYVLVSYPNDTMGKRAPIKLATIWKGPMKVLSHDKDEYVVGDLTLGTQSRVHVTRLRRYYYDPTRENPLDIARRDHGAYLVEAIISHKGTGKTPSNMSFKVRWAGYDESADSWLPWKELYNNEVLHNYLYEQGMGRLVPDIFKRRGPSGQVVL